MDLLGRKILADGGQSLMVLAGRIQSTLAKAAELELCAPMAAQLGGVLESIQACIAVLGQAAAGGELRKALADDSLFLESFGHAVVAWIWLDKAVLAAKRLDTATGDDIHFYQGKLSAARYFYRYELSEVPGKLRVVMAMHGDTLGMDIAAF